MRYDRQTPYHYAVHITVESFPPLIAELNSPVWPGKVIQRPLKREDFHWEENSHSQTHTTRPLPIHSSSILCHFAIPRGTNRVGAPTALRRMCSAQSGSLLFGLWLFSLPLFLYLNDDRKSSPNAVWFSAAPINKAPSDPTGGRGNWKKDKVFSICQSVHSHWAFYDLGCVCVVRAQG